VTEAELLRRRSDWERLEFFVGKSVGALGDDELLEFVRLYRRASRDLSYFRGQPGAQEVALYLNSLVAAAYGALYRRPTQGWAARLDGILYAGASAFRRRWAFTLAAFLIFMAAAILSPLGAMASGDVRAMLVPAGMEESIEGWANGELPERTAEDSSMATAFYATNNPRVGLLTVALSVMTLGLGSAFIMWQNGALIGILTGEVAQRGSLTFLFGSIMPHGVSEIGGIFIAGGVGLLFGWAVIRPGRRSRAESMRQAGKDGIALTGLALVMIFAAAPIEGWFSFNPAVPLPFKWAFASVAFVAWTAYLLGYGRSRDADQRPEA
jgi:uncharacterized membrane protein SpoIIM required for sporulation